MEADPENLEAPVLLGEVSAPSGTLVVLDGGLLDHWCHDRPPVLPQGALSSEEAMATANTAVDLQIDGADAWRAGHEYDRGCHPLFLYDIPRRAVSEMQDHFAEFAKERGFDARATPLDRRITHRERITLLLDSGAPEKGISFHGIWAAVAAGVPPGETFPLYGRRRGPDGEFPGRLHDAYLEILPGAAIHRSESRGLVGVDEARIIFADADALGSWIHADPIDGNADFAFWGKDAEAAARESGAAPLAEGDGVFGWTDLPVDEAARLGIQVEKLRDERDWHFVTDFRPHSHHWQAMKQVRATDTASGTVNVGGADMCLFMTSWGDGIFEVFADYDGAGRLARVRVELGSEQTLNNVRTIEERYFGYFAKFAFVSKRVFEEGHCVRFLYREAPDEERDSGWRAFAGGETAEYNDQPGNVLLVPLRELLERDRGLEEIFRQPEGSVFERTECNGEFVAVTDWKPE